MLHRNKLQRCTRWDVHVELVMRELMTRLDLELICTGLGQTMTMGALGYG